jgi:putative phosphoribosyl transferase
MTLNQFFTIRDRKQAGLLLAEKLIHLRNSDTVVVGVPYGGAVVGFHLAKTLNLSFDVLACKTIGHPADQRKTIGCVSTDHVVIHDEAHDIPRDFIYHQIVLAQNALKAKQALYYGGSKNEISIQGREVIVVGDTVKNADALMATIKTIATERPTKIVVAAVLISSDAVRVLAAEADEIVSLSVADELEPGGVYEENVIIRDEDIRALLLNFSVSNC